MPEDKADTATTASTVEEEEGDIFDAPENAVLIRTLPFQSAYAGLLTEYVFLQMHVIASAPGALASRKLSRPR